jgi:hypothetical protein
MDTIIIVGLLISIAVSLLIVVNMVVTERRIKELERKFELRGIEENR